jgi:hypothetical protein
VKAKKRKNFENIIKAFYELGSHTSLLSENSIVDDKIPLSTTTAAHSREIFSMKPHNRALPDKAAYNSSSKEKVLDSPKNNLEKSTKIITKSTRKLCCSKYYKNNKEQEQEDSVEGA